MGVLWRCAVWVCCVYVGGARVTAREGGGHRTEHARELVPEQCRSSCTPPGSRHRPRDPWLPWSRPRHRGLGQRGLHGEVVVWLLLLLEQGAAMAVMVRVVGWGWWWVGGNGGGCGGGDGGGEDVRQDFFVIFL